ncbi:LAMI_0F03906g1_1 [Lachancea mirantina]|uniref:LAMI_0F03906g1_1 n=1 Tax=Lachancea mirantina TaxID=1230905 RepID=A0A1G4JXK2_9SACH|nr:LAMI_0F03906g1_1 [Lachancea mirantina]
MPVSKSLAKVQKNLKAGKKGTRVHPKGRKLQQLATSTLREQTIAAKKKAYNDRRSYELARFKFIQEVINSSSFEERKSFSLEEITVFVKEFVGRDDEELEILKAKRRANRPPSNRQVLLQQRRDAESEELKSGFLAPDLMDPENVTFLRKWNLSFGSMSTLKLLRVNDMAERVIGGSKNALDKAPDVEMSKGA